MKKKNLDLLGMAAAVLCLAHCLLFPVLIMIPLATSSAVYVDLFFLAIGTAVVYKVTRSMQSRWLKYTFWSGILLIGLSVLLDLLFHMHSLLIYLGAGILIAAHFINFKQHRHPYILHKKDRAC